MIGWITSSQDALKGFWSLEPGRLPLFRRLKVMLYGGQSILVDDGRGFGSFLVMFEVMLYCHPTQHGMIWRNSDWKYLEMAENSDNSGKKWKKVEKIGTGNFLHLNKKLEIQILEFFGGFWNGKIWKWYFLTILESETVI